jgi:beta-phosphoglucomutase-like phosphatase (HAD superfamily)
MAYQGTVFDVDGVLVDSPHELAWRESLQRLMEGSARDPRPDQLDARAVHPSGVPAVASI